MGMDAETILPKTSDDDNDGIPDTSDLSCPAGDVGWSPGALTDYDSDGCRDAGEDLDDDNDGICDVDGPGSYGQSILCAASPTLADECAKGNLLWSSTAITDYDTDGCRDAGEDPDDDNDEICDTGAAATYGDSNQMECRASSTATDECPAPTGNLGWISDQATTDNDEDGCQDSGEDLDDDEDGIGDGFDDCSAGTVGWAPGSATDYDSDGCRDAGEDLDDDNDDICDSGGSSSYGDSSSCEPSSTGTDECTAYSSDLGWTSTPLTDNDRGWLPRHNRRYRR